MQPVIILGKRTTETSPKIGREDHELWTVTKSVIKHWPNGRVSDDRALDWDRHFDLHWINPRVTPTGHKYPGIAGRHPSVWQWYTQNDGTRPIHLQEAHADIPGSVRFPIEDVCSAFPGDAGMFTCQVDLMMAYAITLGAPRIVLNGIGVGNGVRYMALHRGIGYWIGMARGRGIEVEIDRPSVYATDRDVYGYDSLGFDALHRFVDDIPRPTNRAAMLREMRRSWGRTLAAR